MRDRRLRTALLATLLVGATVLAFVNGLHGAFLFDDMGTIVRNPGIRTFPPGPEAEGELGGLRYRVVGQWTLAFDYALYGLEPAGFRVTNIAIHLLAGLLLFGIVRRSLVLPAGGGWAPIGADGLAFAAALLWLVHPLQTGAVTYVIQRLESLAGMFTLAALYGVLRGACATGWLGRGWYVVGIAASTLGMATKQTMIVAPALVLLHDRIFLADSWATLVRRRWLVYAGFVPGALWLLSTVPASVSDPGRMAGFSYGSLTPWTYLASQPGVILHYLRLTAWPDRLCLDYHWPRAADASAVVGPALPLAALALATLVALWRAPGLGFLGTAFFLLLAPSSSLMPLADLAFEHRMYLPLAPVAVAVVLGVHAGARRLVADARARLVLEATLLAAACVALVVRTRARNEDYADRVTMWADVTQCAPHNHRAHHNLGLYLLTERGDRQRGMAELRRAIALAPAYGQPRLVLAAALRDDGHLDEAAEVLRDGVAHNRGDVAMAMALADVLAARGDTAAASAAYAHAARLAPGDPALLDRWGSMLVGADEYGAAADLFRRAVALEPRFVPAQTHLGLALELAGDPAGAIAAHRTALALAPDDRVSRKALARLLATAEPPTLRDGAAAVRLAESLVADTSEPDAELLSTLAAAYAAAGRPADAVAAAERTLGVARSSGDDDLVRQATEELAAYRAAAGR